MARTWIRPLLWATGAWAIACADAKLQGQPPLTIDGSAGTTTAPTGGVMSTSGGVASSGAPSTNAGSPATTAGGLSSTASGGPTPTTAAGGDANAGNPPNTAVPNGYYVAGSWKGQAWGTTTGTGSTIMPSSFADVASGMPYCASGSVAALPDYSGTATVGVNLNQGSEANAPANTVVPSKDGVTVSVTNRGGSALRLELRGPNAVDDANQRWCAPISGDGGFIAWDKFNTACWDYSGSAYNHEPIVSAAVLVPGDNAKAVTYDVCLNSISEGSDSSGSGGPGANSGTGGASNPSPGSGGMANSSSSGGSNPGTSGAPNPSAGGSNSANPGAGGAPSGGGASSAGNGGAGGKPIMNSGTLSERYDWQPVLHEGKNYVVQNNVWGSGASQTITYNETSFKVTAQSGTNGTSGAPVSYPSSFIGANYERATTGSNLPKLVSSIASVQTSWTNNAGGSIGGTYNASYDVWFSTSANGDLEAPSGGYLMVWFYDPANAQPIGSVVAPGVTVSGVSGTWDIWLGNNGNVPCISYVRTQSIQSMTFDLNAFIQNAVGRGTIKSNWYLSNVFAGFEIWSGGVGLESSGFYANVN